MTETTEQIEAHIRRTREDLSANLNELEQKVRTAADWRHHYAKSPGTFIGAALGGGLLLAMATNGRRAREAARPLPHAHGVPGRSRERGPLDESLGVIKAALIGLAANQAKTVLSRLLPGFEGQLPQHEKPKPAAANPARRSPPGEGPVVRDR